MHEILFRAINLMLRNPATAYMNWEPAMPFHGPNDLPQVSYSNLYYSHLAYSHLDDDHRCKGERPMSASFRPTSLSSRPVKIRIGSYPPTIKNDLVLSRDDHGTKGL
jgi:hypothetical protein